MRDLQEALDRCQDIAIASGFDLDLLSTADIRRKLGLLSIFLASNRK
jgi:hypothetical protein